MKDVG